MIDYCNWYLAYCCHLLNWRLFNWLVLLVHFELQLLLFCGARLLENMPFPAGTGFPVICGKCLPYKAHWRGLKTIFLHLPFWLSWTSFLVTPLLSAFSSLYLSGRLLYFAVLSLQARSIFYFPLLPPRAICRKAVLLPFQLKVSEGGEWEAANNL